MIDVGRERRRGGCRWLVRREDEVSLSLSRLGTIGYDVRVRKRTRLTSGDSPSN